MKPTTVLAGLAAVLLAALWLRLPQVTAGLPYFKSEDEAHHFNRLVEMVQDGRFNPRYFNKPSLHFYLRMPVVAASFVWSVKEGELRSIKEIRTRRTDGSRGYATTASHPRIVIWNRAFTLALSLLAVYLAFLLARELTGSAAAGLGAAWVPACSPALVNDAGKIGVDTPMVFMCLLAMLLAVRLHGRFSLGALAVAGLVAGLAFSTKYNAIPILILPLLVCVLEGHRRASALTVALLTPVAGFLLGTPFALVELPAFLDDMASEAWHYGTAGHAMATGTPGWPQAPRRHARSAVTRAFATARGVACRPSRTAAGFPLASPASFWRTACLLGRGPRSSSRSAHRGSRSPVRLRSDPGNPVTCARGFSRTDGRSGASRSPRRRPRARACC